MNLSARDKLMLCLLPAALLAAAYIYVGKPWLEAELEAEKKRAEAAAKPGAAPVSTGKVDKLRSDISAAKVEKDSRKARVAAAAAATDPVARALVDTEGPVLQPAELTRRVGLILRSHRLEPDVSESSSAERGLGALLAALDEKETAAAGGPASPGGTARGTNGSASAAGGSAGGSVGGAQTSAAPVWRIEVDGDAGRFHRALADLSRAHPALVPLSLTLDPLDDDPAGRARRMTLWLRY
jgi:hypothetical protein